MTEVDTGSADEATGEPRDQKVDRPGVTDTPPAGGLTESFIAVLLLGAALVACSRASALALLIAVAALQAVTAVAWVFGTGMPGRRGGLIVAALASAGADVAVSIRPHDGLGVVLPVVGLIIPAVFVHQLTRGAARVQVVASMGAVATLAMCVAAAAAFVQLRHEFVPSGAGGRAAAGVVAVLAVAVAVGLVADLVAAVPRVDADVPRGMLALLCSAAAGAVVGYLLLHDLARFDGGRAVFLGAALGVLAGLMSVAASFVLHTTPVPAARWAVRLRAVVPAAVPLALLAPVGFLLCLAVRS